jgi:hypothetical protein
LLSLMEVKECKINELDSNQNIQFYFSLQNKGSSFYMYEKNSNSSTILSSDSQIECKLAEREQTLNENQNGSIYVWLKLNTIVQKPSRFDQVKSAKSFHLDLSFSDLFSNSNSIIAKIDQLFDTKVLDQPNQLIAFEINQRTNNEFVKQFFRVDKFNGYLITSSDLTSSRFQILFNTLDLIQINIDIFSYEINQDVRSDLFKASEFSFYIHLKKSEPIKSGSIIDSYFERLNGKIFTQI